MNHLFEAAREVADFTAERHWQFCLIGGLAVQQWEETGRILDEMRRAKLRDMPYNWEDVDALLAIGDRYDGPPRLTSGLVEMQAIFMKYHRKMNDGG